MSFIAFDQLAVRQLTSPTALISRHLRSPSSLVSSGSAWKANSANAERDMAFEKSRSEGLSARLGDAQAQFAKVESDLAETRKTLATKAEQAGTQAGIIALLEMQIAEIEKKLASSACGEVGRPKKGGKKVASVVSDSLKKE